MKKTKKITIKINDSEICLEEESVNFYLSETRHKTIRKSSIQKFFNNLINKFINKS